jgi:hypothetical protein
MFFRRVRGGGVPLLLLACLWLGGRLSPAMAAPLPFGDASAGATASTKPPQSPSPPVDISAASAGAVGRVRRVMSEHPIATALVSAAAGALLAQGVPRGLRLLSHARNKQAWAFFNRLVAESHPFNRGDGRFIQCFQEDIFKKLVRFVSRHFCLVLLWFFFPFLLLPLRDAPLP